MQLMCVPMLQVVNILNYTAWLSTLINSKCFGPVDPRIHEELLHSCVSTRIFRIFLLVLDMTSWYHAIWFRLDEWKAMAICCDFLYLWFNWYVFQKRRIQGPQGCDFRCCILVDLHFRLRSRFKHIKCTTERMRNDIQPTEGEELVMERTKTAWIGPKKPRMRGGSVTKKSVFFLFLWIFWKVFGKRPFE